MWRLIIVLSTLQYEYFFFNFNDFRKATCLHLTTYISNTYYAGRQNNRLLGFIRQLEELQFLL